jgi:hypothetical protein
MSVVIVSHSENKVVFNPDQQVLELETGRFKSLYKIDEQRSRRYRRIAGSARLAIRNRREQARLEQQPSLFRRQVLILNRPLDTVSTIGPV